MRANGLSERSYLPMSDTTNDARSFEEYDEPINLDDYDAPDRPDFRRVGRGVPFVVDPHTGKRVRYSRSSNAGKILDDESNLTDWKLRTVVAGAAQRPELMASASVLDIDTNKKELRAIAEQCLVAGKGERRSVIGTAVHAMFDHLDRNDGWRPPPQYLDLCNTYVDTLRLWGLVPEEIEIHCINDRFRLAGTLDRRYRTVSTLIAPDGNVIPIGSYIVGDIKTGKELEYASGSYATQLAAYVDSMRYNVETDEREPFNPPSVEDWALIIHADSADTRVEVYWVDIEAGRRGCQLANEVRAWRRRSDLLTIARRMPVNPVTIDPPQSTGWNALDHPEPAEERAALVALDRAPDETPPLDARGPAEAPSGPVEASRAASRHEYLAGRVRAILAHSDTAKQALARAWPVGVPGLKQTGQSWEQMDSILEAILFVEKNHSVPFYPEWDDPELETSKLSHPSNVWARPKTTKPTADDRENIQQALADHPRSGLLRKWIADAVAGGINHSFDTTALAHALYEFGRVDESEWPDDDITLMLDGSLRALGYVNGTRDLGRFNPEHAPLLMSAAFAIAAGNAMLLFDENERPIVRTNIKQASKGANHADR